MTDPAPGSDPAPSAATAEVTPARWYRTGPAIAATIGLVGALAAALIGLRPWESPAPRLEVVSVAVTDGTSDPETGTIDPTAIDIRLRNVGGQVAVLHQLDMRVLDVGVLRVCEGGAALEPTATYDAVLPETTQPGDVIEVPISHSLEPNTADRIAVRVFPEERPEDWLFDLVLAQLELGLLHDREEQPIDAGRVVIATPWAPEDYWFAEDVVADVDAQAAAGEAVDPLTLEVVECYRTNREVFDRITPLDGERVPLLEPAAGA